MTGGPLDGVRVVDLTTIVIGPICSRTLADYGADVIKVEAPGGDLLRTMAEGSRNPGMSGKFINFNRNKRSIGLDIKQKEGLEALLRLDEEGELLHGPGAELLAREGLLPGQPLQVGDGANGSSDRLQRLGHEARHPHGRNRRLFLTGRKGAVTFF